MGRRIDYTPELAGRFTDLVLARLPMRFPGVDPASRPSWEVVGPAMLVRASTAMRSLFRLRPDEDSWRVAEGAARSVIEQMITFAWLAGAPDTRMPEWLAGTDRERQRADNKFTTWLVQQGYLAEPTPLLEPELRELVDQQAAKLLRLDARALRADKSWRPRIERLQHPGCSFAEIYATAYTHYSGSDHALLQPLFRYVGVDGDGVAFVGCEGNDETSTPWGVGLLVYGLGLLAGAEALGWPDPARVYQLIVAADAAQAASLARPPVYAPGEPSVGRSSCGTPSPRLSRARASAIAASSSSLSGSSSIGAASRMATVGSCARASHRAAGSTDASGSSSTRRCRSRLVAMPDGAGPRSGRGAIHALASDYAALGVDATCRPRAARSFPIVSSVGFPCPRSKRLISL